MTTYKHHDYLFTVIVPVYNVEKFLTRCLTSILEQTLRQIELVIVDDGSTDNSLSICKDFAKADNRVKIISKENEGQGVARNHGLDVAIGKYIIFVDSDDWIDRNLCFDLFDLMEDSEACFANFGLDYVNQNGDVIKTFNAYKYNEIHGDDIFIKSALDNQIYSSPCNKVYRKDLLASNNIRFPAIRASEDVYFSRAISLHAKKTIFTRKVYYHALIREGSTTRSMDTELFKTAKQLIKIEKEDIFDNFNAHKNMKLFEAHVLKLFSYLIIRASFRCDDPIIYSECLDIAKSTGFFDYANDADAKRPLTLKSRVMVYLCLYPKTLKILARALGRLVYKPY